MKILVLTIISVLLSACGSLNTLPKTDAAVAENLKGHKTHCTFLPQIYSGAAYDFCRLNAEYKGNRGRDRYPEDGSDDPRIAEYKADQNGKSFAMLLAADFALSCVIDTVALPYTIYKQNKDGSIILD